MKKKKNKKKINTGKVAIIFSLLLIVVIVFYALLNSNIFNSKNVIIDGNKHVKSEDIVKTLGIKDDKNIFRYNLGNMESELLKNKYIEKVNIKRLLPNTLKVDITEKEIVATLYNEGIYCYIDKEAKFIDEISEEDKDNSVVTVDIYYSLSDLQEINFKNEENRNRLLYLLECMKSESVYKKIKQVDMTDKDSIKMHTNDNIKVLLNKDENLKYNISKVAMILADLQSKNQIGGEIDLSTGKYALYRP